MPQTSEKEMPFQRVVLIVLDSVGIGAMPDASAYGDSGSDTLGHIACACPLHLPNLVKLGLANIRSFHGLAAPLHPAGAFGKCTLSSPGKDTTTGHWEMAGIILDKHFPVYPQGLSGGNHQPVRASNRHAHSRQQARIRHGDH